MSLSFETLIAANHALQKERLNFEHAMETQDEPARFEAHLKDVDTMLGEIQAELRKFPAEELEARGVSYVLN